jgi:hypothetical protein
MGFSMLGTMHELEDVLSVRRFVEDYFARFYGEKPLGIDWVKAVKMSNIWDLSIRAKFKDREYGLAIQVDSLRKISTVHAITGVARARP